VPAASIGASGFSAAELDRIIDAVERGTGPLPRAQLELRVRRVLEWARQVRIRAELLDQVLRGELKIIVPARARASLVFARPRDDAEPTPASGEPPPWQPSRPTTPRRRKARRA